MSGSYPSIFLRADTDCERPGCDRDRILRATMDASFGIFDTGVDTDAGVDPATVPTSALPVAEVMPAAIPAVEAQLIPQLMAEATRASPKAEHHRHQDSIPCPV